MATEFRAQLGAVIHGRYSLDGSAYIYRDPEHSSRRRQGIELHEWVHSELLDTTAFGRFQLMLNFVKDAVPRGDFRDRCAELLGYTFDVCSVAHEGLAAYREFCWIASDEGNDAASSYIDTLPPHYRHGVDQVTTLLGDPLEDPYQGLSPPAFHTWLTLLGQAVMNTPILAEYSNPDRIFEEPLTWLLTDGPDQRLEALEEDAGTISTALSSIAEMPLLNAAVAKYVSTNDPTGLDLFLNLGVDTLRDGLPDMVMLTKEEVGDQLDEFNIEWSERINALMGSEIVAVGPGQDVTHERSLSMRVYPTNYEEHESALAQQQALSVYFGGLADAARQFESPNVVYLAMLDSQDENLAPDNMSQSTVNMLGVPLWAGSDTAESPWVSAQRSFLTDTTFGDLVHKSEKLSQAGWCWYTNQRIVSFLRRLDKLPHGFIFERCGHARNVLSGLDYVLQLGGSPEGYYIRVFGQNETLVGILYERVLSFSFATDLGATSFAKATTELGLAELEERPIEIGSHSVSLGLATRWARWGALGS